MEVGVGGKIFDHAVYELVVMTVVDQFLSDGVGVSEEADGGGAGEDDGAGFGKGFEGVACYGLEVEDLYDTGVGVIAIQFCRLVV